MTTTVHNLVETLMKYPNQEAEVKGKITINDDYTILCGPVSPEDLTDYYMSFLMP